MRNTTTVLLTISAMVPYLQEDTKESIDEQL
jgi:hypothetical protein